MLVSCTHTLHPSIVWCAYFPGFSLCRGNWILSMLVMRACLRINRWLNKHFTSYCLPSTTLWAYLALLSLLSFLPCPSLTLFSFIALSPALVPPLSHFPSHWVCTPRFSFILCWCGICLSYSHSRTRTCTCARAHTKCTYSLLRPAWAAMNIQGSFAVSVWPALMTGINVEKSPFHLSLSLSLSHPPTPVFV